MSATRADAVRVARSYIDTPFHHAARLPGVGLDCAGLVICIMRELGLAAADWDVQGYGLDPDGSFLAVCDASLRRIERAVMQPGDVVAVSYLRVPRHVGVLGDYAHGGFSLIHATNARSVRPPRVVETRLLISREQGFAAAYALPGIA